MEESSLAAGIHTPPDSPSPPIDDAVCSKCRGFGHWPDKCYLLGSSRLSGRALPVPEGGYEPPRFYLGLPWLALHPIHLGRTSRTEDSANSLVVKITSPDTYGDAVIMCVTFMEHLAEYKTHRQNEQVIHIEIENWLEENYPSNSTKNRVLHELWKTQAKAYMKMTRHLVSDMTELIRKFEREAIIIPIAHEIRHFRKGAGAGPGFQFQSQSQPPLISGNSPDHPVMLAPASVNKEVFFSDIWQYVTSSSGSMLRNQELEQVRRLNRQHFRSLIISINSVRKRYLRHKAQLSKELRRSIVLRTSQNRNDPKLAMAFSVPKKLMVQLGSDGSFDGEVSELRCEDFMWPDAASISSDWDYAKEGLLKIDWDWE